ncbi:MAG: hypothetical protein KC547_06590 [Anaerolineae bacterium]|nr:hypothetical protein [Anaerolineae bacterium]
MSALEREIVDKFHKLDKDAQKRVLELIVQKAGSDEQAGTAGFDYDAWFRDVETLRQAIRANHGEKLPAMDVVSLLRDIRDGEDE